MPLHGRKAELEALTDLIADLRGRSDLQNRGGLGDSGGLPHRGGLRNGGGVLIRGEAGIGKSALVAEAASAASAAGLRVLTTTGVQAERDLAYAGLHQLLYPVRAAVATLPARQRTALRDALGLGEDPEPAATPPEGVAQTGVFLVGLAALTLLAEVAAARPLLVVVEDAHWLDRASADVLAFVARRIESEPIAMIVTLREDEPSPLLEAGLAAMPVGRLTGEAAAELLDATAPGLAPPVRARLLEEAAGNPLALTELPATVTGLGTTGSGGSGPMGAMGSMGTTGAGGLGAIGSLVPLGERLERAFTARYATLPPPARAALLVAALNESESVAETLAATARLLSQEPLTDTGAPAQPLAGAEVEILVPAVEARLVELGGGTIRFRHPLMRSAIPAAAPLPERRRAHLALAETLGEQPVRRAWHRAAATAGADEGVAAELDRAAAEARRRGAAAAAVAALEEAARLSEEREGKALRLLRAAELAVESGSREAAERLVAEAREVGLSPRRRATAAWLLSGFEDGVREDVSRVRELAGLAASIAAEGHVGPAVRILWGAAMRCFWSEPGQDARRLVLSVADGLPLPAGDPRLVAIVAYAAPFERGESVLGGLRELAGAAGADPEVDRYLGSASMQVGAFDLAARLSAAAAPGLRAQGRLGLLPRALAVQAWTSARLGDLATAVPAAEEAARLARETGQPFMYGLATAVQAEIAALRGDSERARALADEAERVALPAGARPVLATVQLARGLAAMSEGRFDDAYADLSRILDPTDPACQLALRACFLAELTEAALRAGRAAAARDVLLGLEPLAASAPSPALHIGLRYARAVLAPEEEAEELFAAALRADLTAWPAERARLHLAFGEWLRRRRRAVESRMHLRTARDAFDALGLAAWGERARLELRGAGESSPSRDPDAWDRLTPHELSIAQLAAEGLTNREIGQRLYLSHRTVGTHLHRIFPKLGVSSRADLARVLQTYQQPDE
ncbi:putative transcriptional regulator [[Actinomadura] parvosata subsp. kistnae]|uniref:LuxR family transcriptional regulator n=1 Tax=[Actinomadura] parvosata subsp. kistnae TaxID=1909395 RepID=A0A1V0AHA4_9ACTN|nr:LuxR family transcriptional regulator [Nonomuraea sp. ATCC 55076]AQZ69588.1 LuxR family transcriptional regulator [Nonomuraea sp. ATCC 55076]SPL91723.1 putative transcriptional regulator [Actinomadura parvosata subsp. kistnae]